MTEHPANALAFGAGTLVIAVVHSLASLPWLYLAAIFFFVTAAVAATLYRFFGGQVVAPSVPAVAPPHAKELTRRPATTYEQLARLSSHGEEVARGITWQRMGKSLPANDWRLNVQSFLYRNAPEYHNEIVEISRHMQDDLKMIEDIRGLIHKVMKDPNYRPSQSRGQDSV